MRASTRGAASDGWQKGVAMETVRYSSIQAQRLRPFLEEVARELDDRFIALRRLNRRVRLAERSGEPPQRQAALTAQRVAHNTVLEACLDELTALGCIAELGLPTVIRMPGNDGQFTSGLKVTARYEDVDGEPMDGSMAARAGWVA